MGERLGKDRARRLAKLATAKGRRETGMVLLDSLPLVERALDLGLLRELFHDPERGPSELVRRAEAAGVPCTPAAPGALEKLVKVETTPGVAGVAARPVAPGAEALLGREGLLGILCDRVADPGNLGTIARSAAAFGCDALFLTRGCARPFSPKALRASAGALLHLPSASLELEDPLLRGSGTVLVRTVVAGGTPLSRATFGRRCLVWLGNEAQGVSEAPSGLDAVDVTIPMTPGVESLNVASAAAVILYEIARRGAGA